VNARDPEETSLGGGDCFSPLRKTLYRTLKELFIRGNLPSYKKAENVLFQEKKEKKGEEERPRKGEDDDFPREERRPFGETDGITLGRTRLLSVKKGESGNPRAASGNTHQVLRRGNRSRIEEEKGGRFAYVALGKGGKRTHKKKKFFVPTGEERGCQPSPRKKSSIPKREGEEEIPGLSSFHRRRRKKAWSTSRSFRVKGKIVPWLRKKKRRAAELLVLVRKKRGGGKGKGGRSMLSTSARGKKRRRPNLKRGRRRPCVLQGLEERKKRGEESHRYLSLPRRQKTRREALEKEKGSLVCLYRE